MEKKSIVDEIKKCLKSGIPVAVIAAGVMVACSGCDGSPEPQITSGIAIKPSSQVK